MEMSVTEKKLDGQCIISRVGERNKCRIQRQRKVALIIDNCSVHSEIENLSHVKLIFFHSNTTSVIQPMEQGAIRSLKDHCRKRLVRVILTHLDQGKLIPNILYLKVMQLLVYAWNDVSKETVINCFQKAKIPKKIE